MAKRDFSAITSRLDAEARQRASAAPADPAPSNLLSVRAQVDAISRGDIDSVLAMASPDITLEIFAPPEFPWIRRAQGLDAIRAAIAQNFGAVEDQRPNIRNIHADGDTVVLFGRETGRLKGSGASYDLEFVQKFTFEDGRLASVRIIAARAV